MTIKDTKIRIGTYLHSDLVLSKIVKLLALALTNLFLDLANLAINLAKQSHGRPSHQPDLT